MVIPELKDELERKTCETLEWIVQRHDSSQFSERDVYVALQTVFSIVSGLVSKEFTDEIGMIMNSVKGK